MVEKPGLEAIVEVGRVVGNLIGKIDQLRFQRRAQIEQVFRQLRMLVGIVIVRMLDDAFADLEGEIQAGEIDIALLEALDDAQGVQIVVEAHAMASHHRVQRDFARVSERRMTDVMHQRKSLDQIGIQVETRGDGARDLRNLDGVGQPRAEVVGDTMGENLGLILKPAEGAGVNDAVAVALERGAIGMLGLGVAPSARVLNPDGIIGEHG